jgi:predicted Zn finger-like uncharacterized protein
MSLITRCPACGTMFNVVSDQLKVSQGWVRCGQCAVVFDASLDLQTERLLLNDPPGSYVPSDADFPLPVNTAAVDIEVQGGGAESAEGPDSSYVEEVSAALQTADHPPADESRPSLSVEPASEDSSWPAEDMPDVIPADVSFVRDARRKAFWRKPLVRALLAFLALLLMTLLILQWVVQKRDTLAIVEPRLKPALQMLCQQLGCSVRPARQIEAIVIDSSAFNKVNDAVYRLSFSIKSTAAMTVAMPSLEVTLTDTQDQAVIRRVLTPGQFGNVSGTLGANAEFAGALTLQLTPVEADTSLERRVAGYRLLAFYP